MPAIDIYIPIYMTGKPGTKNEGKKAYQFAKIVANVTHNRVPEGEICLNSRHITVTPPADRQPEE